MLLVSCVSLGLVVPGNRIRSGAGGKARRMNTYGTAGTAGLGRAVGGGSALGAAGSVHVGFGFGLVVECLLLGGVETLVCLVCGKLAVREEREREGE